MKYIIDTDKLPCNNGMNCTTCPFWSIDDTCEINEQVKNLPKYEEEQHGEWTIRKRYTKEGHDDGYGLYCSECNTHLITLSNRGLTLEEARKYLNDHIEKNKFCFNCGASMKREGEEK